MCYPAFFVVLYGFKGFHRVGVFYKQGGTCFLETHLRSQRVTAEAPLNP